MKSAETTQDQMMPREPVKEIPVIPIPKLLPCRVNARLAVSTLAQVSLVLNVLLMDVSRTKFSKPTVLA